MGGSWLSPLRLSHAIMENSTSDNTEWLRRAFIRPPEFVFGSPRRGAACMFSTGCIGRVWQEFESRYTADKDAPEGLWRYDPTTDAGTVDLKDSQDREVQAVLRRPKLLALLGYLAAARPAGFHRRDTLVALLWPEDDNAHARNSLRQAVHALRAALGREAVTARGEEELGLGEQALSCDVCEFAAALEAGAAERALELYRGGSSRACTSRRLRVRALGRPGARASAPPRH